jgi:hypothetical protein
MDEIINKVATSKLEVFDLEDHYPKGTRSQVDISQWLLEAFLLKEKSLGTPEKSRLDSVPKVNLWLSMQHRCYCSGMGYIS